VRHVLSLVERADDVPACVTRAGSGGMVHLHLPLADRADADLLTWLGVANAFIDRARRDGGVLVHCAAGVSRSAAVVMGYLMWKYGHSLQDALRIVRRARPCVRPNTGYVTVVVTAAPGSCLALMEDGRRELGL
jgi:protein-tyrosine phosphatase